MWRVAFLLVAAVSAASVRAEDAAHRADRVRTEQLNRSAGATVDRRIRRNAEAQSRYGDAKADYARQMAAWRSRVTACAGGDISACDTR